MDHFYPFSWRYSLWNPRIQSWKLFCVFANCEAVQQLLMKIGCDPLNAKEIYIYTLVNDCVQSGLFIFEKGRKFIIILRALSVFAIKL